MCADECECPVIAIRPPRRLLTVGTKEEASAPTCHVGCVFSTHSQVCSCVRFSQHASYPCLTPALSTGLSTGLAHVHAQVLSGHEPHMQAQITPMHGTTYSNNNTQTRDIDEGKHRLTEEPMTQY